MSHLVTIGTYLQAKTAYFLKEKLESENIECFFDLVSNVDMRLETVKVQVKEEDVERAIKIMMRIKEAYGMEIEQIEPANRIRKIIVPTDFSKDSEHAAHYAVHLAQKLKAEIKVLHVYENPIDSSRIKRSSTFVDFEDKVQKDREREAQAGILAFTQNLKDYIITHSIKDVKVHSTIVIGKVVRRIKIISKIYKPDTIVLGTVGRREESKSIFAGVANEVITGLEIPVYAIPGPRSSKDFEKLNILYATDFNERDHTSLNQLLKITEPFDKRITCVHIDTEHNPAKREKLVELNEFLQKDYSQHKILCRFIEDKDVYHGLKKYADKNKINLLSFTTRKRGIYNKLFKPNLFRKILQESNLPILIFPS
jgi:nucleotide-binding universal stress UspA family protein